MKLILLNLILIANCFAITGLEVMQKVKDKGDGFIGTKSQMKMTLIDAHGASVERIMSAEVLENKKEGDKSITSFIKPKDIKGTKLLTWTNKKESNKQWLYLPKFKRVKKINSKNQSGSFMGSEFSYEDIGGQVLDKYNYKLISENKSEWIVEAKPIKKSGYSKTITNISKTDITPTKVEYYDRRGELLKVSNLSDFKTYKTKNKSFRIADKIVMLNKQTQKKSIIVWTKREMGIKLKERNFNSSKLK